MIDEEAEGEPEVDEATLELALLLDIEKIKLFVRT